MEYTPLFSVGRDTSVEPKIITLFQDTQGGLHLMLRNEVMVQVSLDDSAALSLSQALHSAVSRKCNNA